MRVLYICRHNPFGTSGGGDIASHAFFRAFSDVVNGDIDLICSDKRINETDANIKISRIYYAPERCLMSKLISPLTGYRNRFITFARNVITENKTLYNIIVFDHNDIAGPLMGYVKELGIKVITIHHNYEKEYFSDNSSLINRMLFLHHVIRWERLSYKNSDVNLFLTSQDKEKFQTVYGKSIGQGFVLGAFEYQNYFPSKITEREEPRSHVTFAITGTLASYQTQDAIRYFFSDLYSYLPKDSKIIIAGRNPSIETINLCKEHDNVHLFANPNNMNDIINDADVYICATRLGGGLKLRVMDGLKNGLPVITHKCSARGFDAFHKTNVFKVFSTPIEFKYAVNEVIETMNEQSMNKKHIQQIYKENFSYDAGMNRLKQILKDSHVLDYE